MGLRYIEEKQRGVIVVPGIGAGVGAGVGAMIGGLGTIVHAVRTNRTE